MGRLARWVPPPSSGAIIFYGRSGSASQKSRPSSSTLPEGQSLAPSTASSTLVQSVKSNAGAAETDAPKDARLSLGEISGKSSLDSAHKTTQFAFGKIETGNGKVVLRLAQELTETFSDVPYVKIVASLVQQIVTIYDEIQANKERSQELISKIMTYGRVVFEALLAIDGQEFASRDVSAIKEDLLQIASVLQSVYDMLNSFTTSKSLSRLKEILFRDDIASKLSEQDRKLDLSITAFQLKSSIVLRSSGVENARDIKKEAALLKVRHIRPLQSKGLRSKPQIVFGRDKEIDVIVNKLLKQESGYSEEGEEILPPRICILGSGGIGKTTLALSVVHHKDICEKYNGERFFVSCEAATSADLLLSEIATALELNVEDTKVNVFRAVLQSLKQAASLLVLDNFETPWDPPQSRSEIEHLITEITSLPTVTLILTMRGSQQPAGTRWMQVIPPLRPVDENSAAAIFKTIAHKDDQHTISLIRAVDCVPLAVTLLANLAAVEGENTATLWSRWEEENTSMVENGQDRLNSLEASIQLSLSSPRMQRDPGALSLLSALSLLPDGISSNTIQACAKGFPDIPSVRKAVSTLLQNALVYEDSNKDLRILSPIRLFVLAKCPPSPRARNFLCDYFMKLAVQANSYHDSTVRSVLQREANNISAVLLDSITSSTAENVVAVIQPIINFCHYTYVSGKGSSQALGAAVEKLETLRETLADSGVPQVVPTRKTNKGSPWYRSFMISSFVKSGKSLLVTPTISQTSDLDPGAKLEADCLGCWGQVLSRQNQFDLARAKFIKAQELHIKVGDKEGQAYDLLNHGLLLSRESKTLEDALKLLQEALELHEKLGDKAGMAYDLLGSAHAHRELGRFSEAKDVFTTTAGLFQDLGDMSGQASALSGLGAIMLFLSKCSNAEQYFTKAAELSVNIGDTIAEAESIAGLAVALLLQSRFSEAKRTIEKAIILRQPVVDPDHLHILGRICIATSDFEQARSLLSRSLAYHEDIGDLRRQAEDNLYLGFIELHEGRLWQVKRLASSAIEKASGNEFLRAEALTLVGQSLITRADFEESDWRLAEALAIFKETGCTLGLAQCLYLRGIQHLRCSEFGPAIESLNEAFVLHKEVGSIQGQADDFSKICEVLMRQGSISESMSLVSRALALHIQIDDKSGQGDDLYIQASLFLIEGRFADAELTMRKALEFHSAAQSLFGIARDNASLSDIIFQRQSQNESNIASENAEDPLAYMRRALKIFYDIGAAGEYHECRNQRRRMQGKEPRNQDLINIYLSNRDWDWDISSDENDD